MNAAYLARVVADAFTLIVAVMLVLRLLPRGRVLRGLLASKTSPARFTPERLQLFAVTLLLAGWYAAHVLAARGGSIPAVSPFCIWAFGISCTLYAVGNAVRSFER